MARSEEQDAARVLREIEERVVWIGAFLVIRGTSNGLTERCAKSADEALAEYKQRFPAIKP